MDHSLFIRGAKIEAGGRDRLVRRDPLTRQVVATYPRATVDDVNLAVAAATDAFNTAEWRDLSPADRSALLLRGADAIESAQEELSGIIRSEVGKPHVEALAEMREGVNLWRYAAASVRSLHGEFYPALGTDTHGFTLWEPVGVVGLILPWNFPFLVSAERLPFMLAAGCAVVVKPSEYAAGTAFRLGEILKQVGFPDGVYNVVSGLGDEAGAALVESTGVAMISFTGSSENGRKVMAVASRTLKRLSLELGGKNPVVVFADAPLERAVDGVISGFTYNAGQCCIATSRLIVQRSVAERFKALLLTRISALREAGAFLQPAATDAQQARLSDFIDQGKRESTLVCDVPAIFEDVPLDSSLTTEEIFGPVLSVYYFDDEEEAVGLANNTIYGLAACVWSGDVPRAMRVARRLRAGRLWINSAQENFPELPVGGYGASGIGREAGTTGIRGYCEIKSVIVKAAHDS